MYVEFDPASGAEGREIGEAVGRLAGAQVLAASEYRAWLERLTDLRQRYPDLELVDAAGYRAGNCASADGQAIAKPNLAPETLWVALRPQALCCAIDPAQLVLLELPIDPGQTLLHTSTALLLDPQTGAIRHQSPNTIGYRVGFYGDAANPTKVPYRGSDWRHPGLRDRTAGPSRTAANSPRARATPAGAPAGCGEGPGLGFPPRASGPAQAAGPSG